jgi:nucleoside 2-deoxyribosyltransferase
MRFTISEHLMALALTMPQLKQVGSERTAIDHVPMVYVAAPYTQPDPVQNTHAVIKIADALLDAGFTPLIPHLTLAWHLVSPKPYSTWLTYDRHLLARCDVLLRVPGYSHGATQECAFADEMGIPVIRPRSADPADCVAALTIHFSN